MIKELAPQIRSGHGRAMAHATLDQSSCSITKFRTHLALRQPEVLIWLEQHLGGNAQEAGIELASRYFEIGERWSKNTACITQFRLNAELETQVPTIDPKDRWMTEIPIPLEGSERIALGRLLRALVAATR